MPDRHPFPTCSILGVNIAVTDMKKTFLISISTLCIGISLPLLLGNTSFNPEQDTLHSDVSHFTASPTVPDQVTFAGQTICMDRYDHRERMDRELMAFTYMHSSTMLSLKRANRYFPVIEPILKECGIPDDFKYLAVIESSLNHLAKSPAGAAGMWQFMQASGRQYGLEVNQNIDERYNLEKATRAACKYLKDAYQKHKSWTNAAAAYNAGSGRITSEQNKQQVQQAFDMLLVSETSRYVFRILAVKRFLERPQDFGFHLTKETFYHTIRTTETVVNTAVADWASWAKTKGITYAQLKYFNPWLRGRSLKNPKGTLYTIKLPVLEDLYYDPKKIHIHYTGWIE